MFEGFTIVPPSCKHYSDDVTEAAVILQYLSNKIISLSNRWLIYLYKKVKFKHQYTIYNFQINKTRVQWKDSWWKHMELIRICLLVSNLSRNTYPGINIAKCVTIATQNANFLMSAEIFKIPSYVDFHDYWQFVVYIVHKKSAWLSYINWCKCRQQEHSLLEHTSDTHWRQLWLKNPQHGALSWRCWPCSGCTDG